jgi:hypothetical protein
MNSPQKAAVLREIVRRIRFAMGDKRAVEKKGRGI